MHSIAKHLAHYIDQAIDFVLPPRCIISGEEVDQHGTVSPESWASLRFISKPFCSCCGFPFEFFSGEDTLCASCLQTAPYFRKARAALFYDDASKPMILSFKHGDQLHAAECFRPWLLTAGHDLLQEADIIVPVPLHPLRLMKRRYNQAAIIANMLSKETDIPYIADLLQRKRVTQSQGHKNKEQRRKNVRGAFVVSPKYSETVQGKKILLIDDVFTSGATVNECARILKKSSACQVDVLTLARVG